MNISQLVLLMLLTTAAPQEALQTPERCRLVVEGTVVDELGERDPDALVIALPNEDGVGGDGAISIGLTDSNGHFGARYNGPCAPPPGCVYLFVTNKVGPLMKELEVSESRNPDWLMAPPFQRSYTKLGPRFRGIRVAVKGRDVINAGAVTVRLRYGEVMLRLLDPTGKPLLSSGTDVLHLPLFWLRVRDQRGEITHEGSVARRAILPEESSIWLALPEGRWEVEIWTAPRGVASKSQWVEVTAKQRNIVDMSLPPRTQ